jgi:UDP-glucose 4-epimerase
MNILLTGSSGFYGSILFEELCSRKHNVFGLDVVKSNHLRKNVQIICNLCDFENLYKQTSKLKIDLIIHLASQIDFAASSQDLLYKNNVVSTKNIAKLGKILKVKRVIFTSSNSVYLGLKKRFIFKNDKPLPIDMYGKSKLESEKILLKYKKFFYVNILRCPNIIDSGRFGMLSILFELLKSNSTLWVLDNGIIKHQCLYAKDLNLAIIKIMRLKKTTIYNIGSENVESFKSVFIKLIKSAGSRSKIRSFPSFLAIPFLKLLYKLKLSPLGPYQFRMLTQDFIFDLEYIKNDLKWKPTLSNAEMLNLAFLSYRNSLSYKTSANSSKVSMGFLNILKFIKF